MNKLFLFAVVALSFVGASAMAESTASASANALSTIYASIAIAKTRDLNFGSGAPNDGAKTVAATDATNSASFNVTAANGAAYNITLPTTINMITGAGGANQTIAVNTFTSSPATSATGTGSAQALTVGATRAAISATQVTGSYSGAFTVTVTYQ